MNTAERDWKEVAENLSRRLADDFITEHKRAELLEIALASKERKVAQLEADIKELARLVMTDPQEARIYVMGSGWCLRCRELHYWGICDAEDWT